MRISLLTVISLVALKCTTAVAVSDNSDWDDYELQRAIAASIQTYAEEEQTRKTSPAQDLSASIKRHMENFKTVQQTTGAKPEGRLAPTTIEEERNDYQLAINRSRLTYMDELKKSGQVSNITKLSDIFPELKPKASVLPKTDKKVAFVLPKVVKAASALPKTNKIAALSKKIYERVEQPQVLRGFKRNFKKASIIADKEGRIKYFSPKKINTRKKIVKKLVAKIA